MSHEEVDPELQAEKERALRDRIFEHPYVLPGFKEPLVAAKEVRIRHAGKADVIVVNTDGQIGIVECKRASNPQSRRYVVGQVFEYAAGLWKCDCDDFKQILATSEVMTDSFKGDRWADESFRRAVSDTLRERGCSGSSLRRSK